MVLMRRLPIFMTIPFMTVIVSPFFGWAALDENRQGHVLTVQGQAFVGRVGDARPQLASFRGQVHPHDVIETQLASRVKVLLPHDILVTIGENSRVELAQFADGQSQHALLSCERGIVRLNVGRPAGDTANRITVQTPTGRIVSQGAYFIVWVGERVAQMGSGVGVLPASSGVFNLGPEGTILLTVEGASVTVKPGQVAIVDPEQHPRLVSQPRLPSLTTVVEATELKDVPTEKPAKEVLASILPSVPMLFTPPAVISGAAALASSVVQGALPPAATAAPVASVSPVLAPGVSPSASPSPVVSPAPSVAPSTVATVPAAISSAGQLLNSLLGNGQGNGNGNGGGRRR
ncbi:MAG: FecR domain-containing protein [Nitrospirales bacterium]|nr:FecR domain-containing protein [Nitrospirales bacterium]